MSDARDVPHTSFEPVSGNTRARISSLCHSSHQRQNSNTPREKSPRSAVFAAAASTLPIGNTTLEVDVQTISRQLHALLVVKLDGEALGIVQMVGKGEGLEAWRQLKVECEGKPGNRQAASLRGILNPRADWKADTRDGRSVLELLNRWEKPSPLSDSERSGHLRWYLGGYGAGSLVWMLSEHPEASPFLCARIVQCNAWLVT